MKNDLIIWNKKQFHKEIFEFIFNYCKKENIKSKFQYSTLKDGFKSIEIFFNNQDFDKLKNIIDLCITSKNHYSFKDGYINIY